MRTNVLHPRFRFLGTLCFLAYLCAGTPVQAGFGERVTLATLPTHEGHRLLEVYTPVGHSQGHTFFVMPNDEDRPVVTHVPPEGRVTQEYLDPQADYRAFPDGHNGFSLGIDKFGYIHITGDMHQFGAGHSRHGKYPYPERYDDKRGAAMLYWRSVKPLDIASGFEFRGAKGSPHLMPGTSWSYGRFFNDRHGELYYSARVRAYSARDYRLPDARRGTMALGLYRYDAKAETWSALGGPPPLPSDNVSRAHDVLFWAHSGRADTGQSYQVYQSNFNFDGNDRLHLAVHAIIGPENRSRLLYAYSDDGGHTWHKADGARIPGLPLRGEDGTANQAHTVCEGGSGICRVVADRNGVPAVNMGHSYRGSYVWDGSDWKLRTDVPGHRGYLQPDGSVVFTSAWALWHVNEFDPKTIKVEELKPGLQTISQLGALTTGDLYGLGVNRARNQFYLQVRDYKSK